jgi:hypothetical protein
VITRTKVSIVALSLTAGLVACSGKDSTDAASDLQRDLQLASTATLNLATPRVDSSLLNSMETKPRAVPQPTQTVKRGAGTRAVRSETPTVLATPDVDVAAVDESSEVETESVAPAPESSEPVAVAPRPAPVVIPASGDYGSGGGIFGGGSGSGRGVVIRGGGVDGDNCELHRPRGGIPTSRGPVYLPPTVPRSGGIFTGASPIGPRTISRPSAPVSARPRASGGGGGRAGGGFSSMRTRMGR